MVTKKSTSEFSSKPPDEAADSCDGTKEQDLKDLVAEAILLQRIDARITKRKEAERK